MCVSLRHVPSAKLQKPLLGVGGTDRHEHHNCTCLASCLRKTERKFNCIGKLKNEKYSTFPDNASTLQGHGWLQRPTALQAAAPSAAGRPPWPSHPCPSLSLASPALGVTATAGHGGALVWPVQALNPPRACRKWEFLTSGLLLVVEDQ